MHHRIDPSRTKNSGKTHDPRRPTHRVDDPCHSTRPGYRPEPEPMPSTASRHQTTTFNPHTRETNASVDASPPEEPDTPEVSIMWVSPSPPHLTSLTPCLSSIASWAQRAAASPPCVHSLFCTSRITERPYHSLLRLSQFINLASGSNFEVGKTLQSCTNTVQVAEAPDFDGHRVVMIDTPGFGDTTHSDTDVLRMIAAFLEAS
jgi:hypothetical protein